MKCFTGSVELDSARRSITFRTLFIIVVIHTAVVTYSNLETGTISSASDKYILNEIKRHAKGVRKKVTVYYLIVLVFFFFVLKLKQTMIR